MPGDFADSDPSNTANPASAYYELSWSILSTIGVANVLFGLVIFSITSLTPVAFVPVVCSAACALANGLCFSAFYTHNPLPNRAVASAFADVFWLVQEAGLSFYSYAILRRVLWDRQRVVFLSLFWILITALVALRGTVMALRARSVLEVGVNFQDVVTYLHIAYFVLIATLECVSAFFLLRKFATAKSTSIKAALRTGLLQYLLQSTEVRVALLALTGITRAITYSFQGTAQSATTTASQVDRFAYTIECLFPVMMYIDILASKLRHSTQSSSGSIPSSQLRRQNGPPAQMSSACRSNNGYPSSSAGKHGGNIERQGGSEALQAQDVVAGEGPSSRADRGDLGLRELNLEGNPGHGKTVEHGIA